MIRDHTHAHIVFIPRVFGRFRAVVFLPGELRSGVKYRAHLIGFVEVFNTLQKHRQALNA